MAGRFFHFDTPSYQRIVGENVVLTDETISATARMAFKFIVARIESDHERYLETTKQNRERQKRFVSKQKLTNSSQILTNANDARNRNKKIEIESEKENENESEKENEKEKESSSQAAEGNSGWPEFGSAAWQKNFYCVFQSLCRGKQYSLH